MVIMLTQPVLQMQRMVRAQQEELQLKYGLPKNAEIEAGSEIFNCFSPADKTVNLSSVTATQHFDYDLSAKMVVAEGRQLSDVTPGEFLSPATFTISYQ